MNVYMKTGLIGLAVIGGLSYGMSEGFIPTPTRTVEKPKSPVSVPNDNAVFLPEQGCSDQTVLKVVRSIRTKPNKWNHDGYRMSKGTGWFDGEPLRIWVANGVDGLDFITTDNMFSNEGIDYPFTDQCRILLYDTVSGFSTVTVNSRIEDSL